ncbi:MAG: sulfotransferase domain-containing protein [Bacteroidota bacterium]
MYRIHASYHKCLTQYYMKVMRKIFNWLPGRERYRHFESIEGVFYNNLGRYKVLSTNNFRIELERLGGDFRLSRFIRDPRDLIVSGYFYHRRGAEPWFRMQNPTEKYWEPLNGHVPDQLTKEQSYTDYLQTLSKEEGLRAEIAFRKYHLESMRNWSNDERIKLFKYEEILGNEVEVFSEIMEHYGFSSNLVSLAKFWANKYRYKSPKAAHRHIRNPKPAQWREHFSPQLQKEFNEQYGDILETYGYPIN